MSAVRLPEVLDVSAIVGDELRIHPEDMRDLQEAFRFCWPRNAERDVFNGTKLITDIEAPLLPRKRL